MNKQKITLTKNIKQRNAIHNRNLKSKYQPDQPKFKKVWYFSMATNGNENDQY